MSTNSTTSEEASELNHKGHNTRIYVLHHNANPDANKLITSIYRWFRTGSKAGIPVYVRTNHTSQRYSSDQTYEAMELPYAVHANDAIRNKNLGALEYLLILIDPHMVNSVSWREYLNKLLVCESRSKEGVWKSGGGQGRVVLVPIAFDDSAFNLPSGYSSRNMIRFNAATGSVRELLKNITESILQDMTPRIGRYADLNEKFRIFISYARADSEAVPKRLRSYIQSNTQFDAFLDENDILYGRNFKDVISDTLSKQATALFAIQGDNYADRPWCRYELQSFRYPRNITETFEESITDEVFGVKSHNRIKIYNIMPIVTINSAQGDLETRVIPELAQSPLIHWASEREDKAMECFSTLIREALFNVKNTLEAIRYLHQYPGIFEKGEHLIINRLPDPITLTNLISMHGSNITVHYPGQGIKAIEHSLIKSTFRRNTKTSKVKKSKENTYIGLKSFKDLHHQLPKVLRPDAVTSVCSGRYLCLSMSVPHDFQELGYIREHFVETLEHLIRPFIRQGMSLIYAGKMPTIDGKFPGKDEANLTNVILDTIATENLQAIEVENIAQSGDRANDQAVESENQNSKIVNPISWPDYMDIKPGEKARWIRQWIPIPQKFENLKLSTKLDESNMDADFEPTAKAISLNRTRERLFREGIEFTDIDKIPESKNYEIAKAQIIKKPINYLVVMGGSTMGFTGFAPGVFEEFYNAIVNKVPVFLMGGLGGAASILASHILESVDAEKTDDMTHIDRWQDSIGATPTGDALAKLTADLQKIQEEHILDPNEFIQELKSKINDLLKGGEFSNLMNNGLDDSGNRELLETADTDRAVRLVWEGIATLIEREL